MIDHSEKGLIPGAFDDREKARRLFPVEIFDGSPPPVHLLEKE